MDHNVFVLLMNSTSLILSLLFVPAANTPRNTLYLLCSLYYCRPSVELLKVN